MTISTTRYFKGETLLFILSRNQRDFLEGLPTQLTTLTAHHIRCRADVLAQNGLVRISGDPEPRVYLTDVGRAAIAFYDTLRGATHASGRNGAERRMLDGGPLIARSAAPSARSRR